MILVHSAALRGTSTVPCCTVLYHTALCCIVLYHTVPCCIVLYHTVPCCTVLYHAVPALYSAVSCCTTALNASTVLYCAVPIPHMTVQCWKVLYQYQKLVDKSVMKNVSEGRNRETGEKGMSKDVQEVEREKRRAEKGTAREDLSWPRSEAAEG